MLVLAGLLHKAGGLLGGFVGGLVGGATSVVVNPILDAIGHAVGGAAAWMVKSMATFWMRTPTPALTTGADSSTPTSTVAFIQGHLWWYMTAAAVVGVLVGCGRMAWEKRGEAGLDVLRGLAVFLATVGCGLTVISLATTAADEGASWIINASTGGNFGTEVGKLTTLTALAGGGLNGVILVCVFGALLILSSLIQMVLMLVRGGMLVLLVGVLPTTAAFSSTQVGRQWNRKAWAWLIAFILYKPAAAIVYATAFSLAGNGALGSGSVTNVISGLMLMVLAILALPALMKFVAPMVGATAAGGLGTVLGAAAGGAAGVSMLAGPTGALRGVSAASGGAGAAMGGGSPGPQGSSGAPSGGMTALAAAGSGVISSAGAAGGTAAGAAATPGGSANGVNGAGSPGPQGGAGAPGGAGPQGGVGPQCGTGAVGATGPSGPQGAGQPPVAGSGGGAAAAAAGGAGAAAHGAASAVDPSGAADAPTGGME